MDKFSSMTDIIKVISSLKPENQTRTIKYMIYLLGAIYILPNMWNNEFQSLTSYRLLDSIIILITIPSLILFCGYITKILYNKK